MLFIIIFKGNLFGDMPLGPVSVNAKVDLKLLSGEKREDIETKLCILSQP